ncbi:MAG: FecR family protein [Lentimicrobiaceae bacterium]|nr:FecR family protein [Lentimicrobiaceae bacterium]
MPNSITDIKILLAKYLDNKCTLDEKLQLYKLVASSENENFFKELLFSSLNEYQDDNEEQHPVDFDRNYVKLLSEIKYREAKEIEKRLLQRKNKVKRLVFGGISVAAVFCIAFFLGSILTHNKVKATFSESAVAVTYSEVSAPFGAKSEVKLADGTEVILNAGSTIKYKNNYNTNNRDIFLEGEAYFKVAKNQYLPLIVSAGNLRIKAVGTEFNVKAYSEEGIVETTLIEGKVDISQRCNIDNNTDEVLQLKPNQKAIYASQTDQITLEKIKEIEPLAVIPSRTVSNALMISPKTDIDQVTAWTKNKLIIRSENIESLCVKLRRKYDMKFVFGDEEIKKYRFTGVLLDETFEQVMAAIKLVSPIDYKLDGKTVTLVSNKKQIEKYSTPLKDN